jgi:polyphosphate kinase 2 (PPK2 family)
VLGYCTPEEYRVPEARADLERMLVDDGIILTALVFCIRR